MAFSYSEPLSVAFLQQLTSSLKQNLAQAARLWVWLQFLYGDEAIQLDLPATFSFADCRDALFGPSHASKSTPHDPDCLDQKQAVDWLFAPSVRYPPSVCAELAQSTDYRHQQQEKVQQFAQALRDRNAYPKNFDTFLSTPLFSIVTNRTLSNDLSTLAGQGWLVSVADGYQRVDQFPVTASAISNTSPSAEFLVQPDLAVIADNLAQTINGQRRFFVYVDYVVPTERHDAVEDWQALLRQLWQQTEPPLVQLTYWSATLLKTCTLIVHPVCIYYYRRGPYLCGYGQVPGQNSQLVDWRNYRLDRIHSITTLTWDTPTIPDRLLQSYQQQTLPHPDNIELRMAEVWGFDYYQPARQLLIRFDTLWDRRYIQNSLRHPTFQPVSFEKTKRLIEQALTGKQRQHLLHELVSRSSQDAYYQATYRHHDPNVRQRLRAWRPHVEILLPWDLRQQVAAEVKQEIAFYENDLR